MASSSAAGAQLPQLACIITFVIKPRLSPSQATRHVLLFVAQRRRSGPRRNAVLSSHVFFAERA
jgi:hypothetical protein